MIKEQWQRGNDSNLSSLERLELHILWLQQLHAEMKQVIIEKKIKEFNEDKDIQGFPRD
jgi:hypothetical protein